MARRRGDLARLTKARDARLLTVCALICCTGIANMRWICSPPSRRALSDVMATTEERQPDDKAYVFEMSRMWVLLHPGGPVRIMDLYDYGSSSLQACMACTHEAKAAVCSVNDSSDWPAH